MHRSELEHLIRAAASIVNEYELMIVGSQSILGAVPDAPEILLRSEEADIYPLNRPDLADVIEGAIGEESRFHETFGYYAQAVGPETATLPAGWQQRLHKIQNQNTDLKIGYCLDPVDLAASKAFANREKDWVFIGAMLQHGICTAEALLDRVGLLPIDAQRIDAIKQRVSRTAAELKAAGGP